MKRVLLVDDDPVFRKAIKRLFRQDDYDFLDASSPAKGIEILDSTPDVHVILLDLSFGGKIGGTAVLDHIKERADDYRVIVVTGHDDLLPAETARENAVFNYLPKTQGSGVQAVRFSVEQAFQDLERQRLDHQNRFLMDVQKRVTESKDVPGTLDLICRAVQSTVGAYTCHIRVYDFKGGDYHLGGFAGPLEVRKIFEAPKTAGSLFSGRVVNTGISEPMDDLQNMPEFHRLAAEAAAKGEFSSECDLYWKSVRSAYIVPISTGLYHENVDAVLNVSSRQLGYFDRERQEAVKVFVTPIALTITKDWLQRKREEIHSDYDKIGSMLSDMTEGMKDGKGLQGIYDVVIRRIAEIVRPEMVSIFMYDQTSGSLCDVAEYRGSEVIAPLDEVYQPGESLTGSVFKEERVIQLPDPRDPNSPRPMDDPRYNHQKKDSYLQFTPSKRLEHYLGVPIWIGGQVRGVLRAMNKRSVYYDESVSTQNPFCLLERGFSIDCRNVMEITARHLGVAIRNTELLDEKDHQLKQIQSLGEVSRLISSELNIEDVLSLTIQNTAEVMHAEICLLFLKEGEDRIVLKQAFGMPMIPEASYLIGEGVTGGVAKTGIPTLLETTPPNDGKYDAAIREYLTDKRGTPSRIESLMVVPITTKGTTLGALKVINKVGDLPGYQQSDLDFFQTFADYVAVAIENARIYKVANDRLAVAERGAALALLVKAVAHEIGNTTGLIQTNVELVREESGTLTSEAIESLEIIEEAAAQATAFANEIGGFSPKTNDPRRPLCINKLVSEAMRALEAERSKYSKSHVIDVKVDLCQRPLVCNIYKGPFRQAVRNIVINAFQALESRENAQILVSTNEGAGQLAGRAVIRIRDNGPGILPENTERIFEPEFTTKAGGNGIGLWLTHTQLGVVDGSIEVESEPGRGATFTVAIPLVDGDKQP